MTAPLIYAKAVTVTASDVTNFTDGMCRAIYVGGAGAFTAIVQGVAVPFAGALAGTILPIQCTRINATGLVASGLVALY